MRKIKIIADSTSDLNKDYLLKHEIEVLPLGITFGDKSYEDGVNLTTSQLYNLVEETGTLPKTSAISYQTFVNAYKKWVEAGYDVLCFSISGDLSSCYQNAVLAAEEFSGHVLCVDSRNLSSGIGLIILKAVKYKDEGKSIQEIKELLENRIIPNVRSQFVVDTLDYLYKGGRCSSLVYMFGKHLHIHPIILVKDGRMIVYRKPRGKMINGLDELLKIFESDLNSIDEDCVMITHSMADEYEEYLHQKLLKLIPETQIMVTHAGSVISSHCGKGTIGILYIKK